MGGHRIIRRSWRAAFVGMILLRVTIGLPALFTWPSPASGEDASPVADASLRRLVPLTGGWLIKQLDNDQPDLAALTRDSASPDKTWLSARMPAQVHDVLVAHGLIADPHVGKNAAACAWVGEKDWAYVCRFPTPEACQRSGVPPLRRARHAGGCLPERCGDRPFREHVPRVRCRGEGPPRVARSVERLDSCVLLAAAVHAQREAAGQRPELPSAQEPPQVP